MLKAGTDLVSETRLLKFISVLALIRKFNFVWKILNVPTNLVRNVTHVKSYKHGDNANFKITTDNFQIAGTNPNGKYGQRWVSKLINY